MRRARWILLFAPAAIAACGWNPKKPFERESPQVREAIQEYDAGKHKLAGDMLEDYLSTGAWTDDLDAVEDRASRIIYF